MPLGSKNIATDTLDTGVLPVPSKGIAPKVVTQPDTLDTGGLPTPKKKDVSQSGGTSSGNGSASTPATNTPNPALTYTWSPSTGQNAQVNPNTLEEQGKINNNTYDNNLQKQLSEKDAKSSAYLSIFPSAQPNQPSVKSGNDQVYEQLKNPDVAIGVMTKKYLAANPDIKAPNSDDQFQQYDLQNDALNTNLRALKDKIDNLNLSMNYKDADVLTDRYNRVLNIQRGLLTKFPQVAEAQNAKNEASQQYTELAKNHPVEAQIEAGAKKLNQSMYDLGKNVYGTLADVGVLPKGEFTEVPDQFEPIPVPKQAELVNPDTGKLQASGVIPTLISQLPQLFAFAGVAKGVEGVINLAGLSEEAGAAAGSTKGLLTSGRYLLTNQARSQLGILASGTIIGYNANYNAAVKAGVQSEEDRNFYALNAGLLSTLPFLGAPVIKQIQGLGTLENELSPSAENYAKMLGEGNSAQEAFKRSYIPKLKSLFENTSAMTLSSIADKAAQYVSNVQTGKHNFDASLSPNELGNMIVTSALTSALFSLPAGGKGNQLYRESLFEAAKNPDKYIPLIKEQFDKGHITEKNYNEAIDKVTSAQLIYPTLPDNLNAYDKAKLLTNIVAKNGLQEKIKSADESVKPQLKEQEKVITQENNEIINPDLKRKRLDEEHANLAAQLYPNISSQLKPKENATPQSEEPQQEGNQSPSEQEHTRTGASRNETEIPRSNSSNSGANSQGREQKPSQGEANPRQALEVDHSFEGKDYTITTNSDGEVLGISKKGKNKKGNQTTTTITSSKPEYQQVKEDFEAAQKNKVVPLQTGEKVTELIKTAEPNSDLPIVKPYDKEDALKGVRPENILHFNQGMDKNRITLLVDSNVKSDYSSQLQIKKQMVNGGNTSFFKHVLKDIAKEYRDDNGSDVIVDLRGKNLDSALKAIKEEKLNSKNKTNAETVRGNKEEVPKQGAQPEKVQNNGSEDLQRQKAEQPVNAEVKQPQGGEVSHTYNGKDYTISTNSDGEVLGISKKGKNKKGNQTTTTITSSKPEYQQVKEDFETAQKNKVVPTGEKVTEPIKETAEQKIAASNKAIDDATNRSLVGLFDNIQNEVNNGSITQEQIAGLEQSSEAKLESIEPLVEDIEHSAESAGEESEIDELNERAEKVKANLLSQIEIMPPIQKPEGQQVEGEGISGIIPKSETPEEVQRGSNIGKPLKITPIEIEDSDGNKNSKLLLTGDTHPLFYRSVDGKMTWVHPELHTGHENSPLKWDEKQQGYVFDRSLLPDVQRAIDARNAEIELEKKNTPTSTIPPVNLTGEEKGFIDKVIADYGGDKKEINDALDRLKNIPDDRRTDFKNYVNSRGAENVPPNETGNNAAQTDTGKPSPTGIRNSAIDYERKEAGLTPIIPAAKREFQEFWDAASKIMDENPNKPLELIKEMLTNPRPLSAVENAVLTHYKIDLDNQFRKANKAITDAAESGDTSTLIENEYRLARLSDERQRLDDAIRRSGNENALGLVTRSILANEDYTLASMDAQKRAANGGRALTPEERKSIIKQYNRIVEISKELERRVHDLEAKERTREQKASDVEQRTYKQKAKRLADKVRTLKSKSLILKDANGNPIVVHEQGFNDIVNLAIEAVAKTIEAGGSVADAIKEGIDFLRKQDFYSKLPDADKSAVEKSFSDFVQNSTSDDAKRLEAYKVRVQKNIEEINKRTANKDFAPKPKPEPLKLDNEALKLQAELQRAKDNFQTELYKDKLKQRNFLQRALDTFVKWQRAFKLSGLTILPKLVTTGAASVTETIPLEILNKGITKIIPALKENAEGEGGATVKEVANAFVDIIMKGIKDSGQIIKRGKSDIDRVYGSYGNIPPELSGWFGQLHSALKAPFARYAFELALKKIARSYVTSGVDISEPFVQTEMQIKAMKVAYKFIFQGDTHLTDAYQRGLNALKNSTSQSAQAVGKGLQWLLPFVKIPTNVVHESLIRIGGTPVSVGQLAYHFMKTGLDAIPEEEKARIIRTMSKGFLGIGAMAIGYYNPRMFGGLGLPWQRQDKKYPKYGSAKVGDADVPFWALEAPLIQAMQFGATVRHIKDSFIKSEHEKGNIPEGVFGGLLGLTDETPYAKTPLELSKIFQSPKERNYYFDNLAKNTADPTLLQEAAQWTDIHNGNLVNRKESDLKEQLESGIPGLRETLPIKR